MENNKNFSPKVKSNCIQEEKNEIEKNKISDSKINLEQDKKIGKQ